MPYPPVNLGPDANPLACRSGVQWSLMSVVDMSQPRVLTATRMISFLATRLPRGDG